jgi:hypothetical protein
MTVPGIYTHANWTAGTNAASYIVNFYQTNSSSATGGTLFQTVSTTSLVAVTTNSFVGGFYYYAAVQSINVYGTSAATVPMEMLQMVV